MTRRRLVNGICCPVSEILENDKQLRIDNQYYLKNRDVPIDYDKVLEFVMKVKEINTRLTKAEINEIRKRINSKD